MQPDTNEPPKIAVGNLLKNYSIIYAFIDFGNVNKWFSKDIWDINGKLLGINSKIIIDIKKLGIFVDSFSVRKIFYYGVDVSLPGSLHLKVLANRSGFKTVSKNIQWIKHYLNSLNREYVNATLMLKFAWMPFGYRKDMILSVYFQAITTSRRYWDI